jgi:hypothetical protein
MIGNSIIHVNVAAIVKNIIILNYYLLCVKNAKTEIIATIKAAVKNANILLSFASPTN